MRADNRGEGGSLALLALAERASPRAAADRVPRRLGIVAAALFYGDSMITPAISVLSAVEGLKVAAPSLEPYIVPITVGHPGRAVRAAAPRYWRDRAFCSGRSCWCGSSRSACSASRSIAEGAARPVRAQPALRLSRSWSTRRVAFLACGSVFLAVTGAEALYADMGHFGRSPIRLAWYRVVFPALVLNYFGQGALLLANPEAIDNPFYPIAPGWAPCRWSILATLATIIASQAVISGAFSMTQQAMQLGYLPRMRILHTSEHERGQIYIPSSTGRCSLRSSCWSWDSVARPTWPRPTASPCRARWCCRPCCSPFS